MQSTPDISRRRILRHPSTVLKPHSKASNTNGKALQTLGIPLHTNKAPSNHGPEYA